MRSEEFRILIGEDLGRKIRKRALQLGIYPADYARIQLAQAVERDLKSDIAATHLLTGGGEACGKKCQERKD